MFARELRQRRAGYARGCGAPLPTPSVWIKGRLTLLALQSGKAVFRYFSLFAAERRAALRLKAERQVSVRKAARRQPAHFQSVERDRSQYQSRHSLSCAGKVKNKLA